MTRLILCSASAGSGKTHSICEHVLERIHPTVGNAPLDPARVIAMTFTKAAAAELKARIQRRILEAADVPLERRLELAERLELAVIGTVHSVGHQLLSRYAVQVGLSPDLEVIEAEGEQRHLDRLLAEMDPGPWEALAEVARRLRVNDTQTLAKELLAQKRANRIPDGAFRAQMRENAGRTCELLGAPDARAPDPARLYDVAREALDRLDGSGDGAKKTQSARQKLAAIVSARSSAWQDFPACARLEAAKTGDGALADLRAFAIHVRRMPALHADVRDFMARLAEQTLRLGEAYARYKAERGLLDFTDLEERLLGVVEREDLAAEIASAFGLVVVDEFQDTSPMQLAIFLRLRDLVAESYWVGDPKQAIYGFRGADADLMRRVWGTARCDDARRLDRNHRSQGALVRVLNALFGPGATLDPTHPPEAPAVERWLLESKNQGGDFRALVRGIRALRDEGIPYGDVAVLFRSNAHVGELAQALREAGIPASAPLAGLLRTRECVVALAGLQLLADPNDSLATATLAHFLAPASPETPAWLEARLSQVRASRAPEAGEADAHVPGERDARLARLRAAATESLSPRDALLHAITSLDLPTRLAGWGEPARRAAHLDALLGLGLEYESACAREGVSATLVGLARWLQDLEVRGEDTLPTPEGLDAVTVLTQHGAKGLQWPVVVVPAIAKLRDPDPWEPKAEGGDPSGGRPLDGRRLRFWAWPFGFTQSAFGTRHAGCDLHEDALASPEGQAASVAQREEDARLLYVAMTRARRRLVVAQRREPARGENALSVLPAFGAVLGLAQAEGDHRLDSCDAIVRVRSLDPDAPHVTLVPEAPHGWVAEAAAPPSAAPRRYVNPSEAVASSQAGKDPPEALGGALPAIRTSRVDALGKAVHAYFAALPGLEGGSRELHEQVARRCLAGWRVEGEIPAAALVEAGDRLRAWARAHAPGAVWWTEVGATGPREDGSQWVGVADLLLVEGNRVLLVDHKSEGSARGPAPDVERHAGQLGAYSAILRSSGLADVVPVVHLPFGGAVVRVKLGAPVETHDPVR